MSEELSRVKSRNKQYKREGRSTVKTKSRTLQADSAKKNPETPAALSGTLSRKARYSSVPARSVAAEQEKTGENEERTPSRAETYPSERVRLSKIFVNTLIFMFVLLVASLFWWGKEGAPELRTLW